MRLFVAVDLDEVARAAILEVQQRLRSAAARGNGTGRGGGTLRWIQPQHLHLTMVFLGNVDDGRVPSVIEAYARPVVTAPFEMIFRGLGVFPPRGAPRALWIGVGAGHREIIDVQHTLAERAHELRIPIEQRAFSPHLTLARWKESRPADRTRLLGAADDTPIARVVVNRATLYKSQLSSAGPTYTALAHATLTTPR